MAKAAQALKFGRPPNPHSPAYQKDVRALVLDLARYLIEMVRELEQHSQVNDRAVPSAYEVTNVTPDRAYDANSTTTDELADVLGTLIEDLKEKGVLT